MSIKEQLPFTPSPPENMPEIERHLSSLAVLHQIPNEELKRSKPTPDTHVFADLAGREYLDMRSTLHTAQHLPRKPKRFRLPFSHDPMKLPEWAIESPEAQEKEETLRAIHETIRRKARTSWLETANILLGEAAETEPGHERNTMLVGAAVCVQFSPDEARRMTFLEGVYRRGIQEDMAAACQQSPLVVLIDDLPKYGRPRTGVKVHSVKSFAPAFQLDQKEIATYLEHVRANASQLNAGNVSVKALSKRLAEHSKAGTTDEALQEEAVKAGQNSEKVGGPILDIRKIERFALQQDFIEKQMPEIIGSDVKNTPLKKLLEEMRFRPDTITDSYDISGRKRNSPEAILRHETAGLLDDTASAFMILSEPVSRRFSLEGVDVSDKASLTLDQQAALRYRTVTRSIEGHMAAARFINLDEFIRRENREMVAKDVGDKIGDTSLSGGDAPRSTVEAIRNIIGAALHNKTLGPVSPEELRDVIHSNRWKLLQTATYNISDLRTANKRVTEPGLKRGENSRLEISNAIKTLSKESLDVYAAVTLGCPALRLTHADRKLLTVEQKAAHGSANYIDHVLAAIINEAYDRGLFDLAKYRTAA